MPIRHFSVRVLSLMLALMMTASHAATQTISVIESSLRVSVLDQSGAAVIAADVQLKRAGSKEVAIQTDERGQSLFTRLAPGQYHLHVEAAGFEPRDLDKVIIKAGGNHVEVRLAVAGVREEVTVKQDEREKASDPRGNAFTNVLTEDQIAALPDDPEEFEAAVRSMAGPGAPLRVNGFRGGKLPPKSQIRQIRFRMNPYAAENHEADFMSIDVYTKPGIDSWHSSLNIGFRDESLNARNAFAPARGPEQHRRFGFSMDGPLWRNHTSLFLSADGFSSYDSKTIVAALPGGTLSSLVRRPSRTLNASARLEHVLTKSHTLHAEYQRNANRQDSLGVGDFDLPERAYLSDQTEHLFRLSDSGMISKRLVNEFRFQARWQELDLRSATELPAILVLNAFNRGGAQVGGNRRARELELVDNVDFVFGKHSFRVGVQVEAGSYASDDSRNANGTFTFASLADYSAGRPTTYTRRVGDPRVAFNQYQFGWYVQDDVRLIKSLSLSFGLRHETQNNLDDNNNFAPRVGVTWSPFKDGKTVLRGGAGIFYDWLTSETFEQTIRVNGERQREIVVRNPGFPSPFSTGMEILLPPGRIQLDPALQTPYLEQVSFGVERKLGKVSQLRANYMWQRGVHLLRGHNINAPVAGLGRPDPAVGNINQIESTANSTMNGLMVGLFVTNPAKHFHLGMNYFLSKTTNESDGPLSMPADNFDLRPERGPSPGDARHRLFAMLNMSLFKGIRLGTMFRANSAMPYNITTGFDDNGDSVSNDRPEGVRRNSARGAAHWDVGTRLSWGFGFGKAPEPAGQGGRPRLVRINGNDADVLGSMPSMPGGGDKRYRVEFYAQAYNLFNHTNLINFTGVETSPFFGQATAAQAGRRIETGMKFSF
jgi:hypothetical protein